MCCSLISPVCVLAFVNLIVLCCVWICASLSMNAPGCQIAVYRSVSWKNKSIVVVKDKICSFPLYWRTFWCRTAMVPHHSSFSSFYSQSSTDSHPCFALQRWRHGPVSGRQHRGHQAVSPQRGHHAHPWKSVVQQPRPAAAGHHCSRLLQPCR